MENLSTIVSMICSIMGVLIALIGTILCLLQWKESCAIKRCEYNDKILDDFRKNKELTDTRYKFEYNDNWYNIEFHGNNSEIEKEYDNYFLYVNYICFLYNTKRIKKKEFAAFEYLITRVCTNEDAQAYFWNLYHFAKRNHTTCSFNDIINYCYKNKIIKKSFFKNSQNEYEKKYLNF